MTQSEAWSIFQATVAAESPERAYEVLAGALKSRRELRCWLGQIGHRQDTRLGEGKSFDEYVKAVSVSLWRRAKERSL
jgi:hypothetical protein